MRFPRKFLKVRNTDLKSPTVYSLFIYLLVLVQEWEAWEGAMETTSYTPGRSEKEEKALWKVLHDLYKKDAAKTKKAEAKKLKEVAKARKQMGVGRNQPSIMEQIRVAKEKCSRVAPESGWGSGQWLHTFVTISRPNLVWMTIK